MVQRSIFNGPESHTEASEEYFKPLFEARIFWATIGTRTEIVLGVPAMGKSVVTRGSNEVVLHNGLIRSGTVIGDGSEILISLGTHSPSDAIAAERTVTADIVVADLSGEPDPDALKVSNRHFVTEVTMIAITEDGKPKGLAVNA